MDSKPIITSVEVIQYETDAGEMDLHPALELHDILGVFSPYLYKSGDGFKRRAHGIRIHTNAGVSGEYISIGFAATDFAAVDRFAPSLIGRNALNRDAIYNDFKQAMRQQARMGMGVVDVALWDLAGKYYGAPVYELLGGSQRKLPCYATTPFAGTGRGLNSAEDYADLAERCLQRGFPGFKIHPWAKAHVRDQIAIVEAVGKRVGGKMDLMMDASCWVTKFGDALKLGWACDEYNFFWYEDPFMDGGVSIHAHRKLRELIKTPLLQLEHVRGLEAHVDFIEAGATDFVRGDPDYDGGITGVMKIAHAAEGFGLDVELHAAGPERRHIMASMRNTNYYEMGMGSLIPVKEGYRDGYDVIDSNGCVDVPEGPGLGVEYDWDFVNAHRSDRVEYK